MNTMKILSLNLLNDHSFWDQRSKLIVDEVKRHNPDIIALQEFLISKKTSQWVEESFPGYETYLCPKTGVNMSESLAILSKIPINEHATLSYGTQKRVAQKISIELGRKTINIANTHMYFGPLRDKPRLQQVHKLIDWLPTPAIVCGDFNAEPHLPSIAAMRKRFFSAYKLIHGSEPEWTCPTPLKRGKSIRHGARHVGLRAAGIYKHQKNVHWRGTIDYIFVDKEIKVKSCDLAFDQPSNNDKKIFPSDHLGLVATISVK